MKIHRKNIYSKLGISSQTELSSTSSSSNITTASDHRANIALQFLAPWTACKYFRTEVTRCL